MSISIQYWCKLIDWYDKPPVYDGYNYDNQIQTNNNKQ